MRIVLAAAFLVALSTSLAYAGSGGSNDSDNFQGASSAYGGNARADQNNARDANLSRQLNGAAKNGGKAKFDTKDRTLTGYARAKGKDLSRQKAAARLSSSGSYDGNFGSFGANQSWRN